MKAGRIEPAKEVMTKVAELVRELDKFNKANKNDRNLIQGVYMMAIRNIITEYGDPAAGIGMLELVKSALAFEGFTYEEEDDRRNYIG